MRGGQKGPLTRVGAETGARPSAPRAAGYQSVYLFGAVCPARDLGCALILPRRDTAAMSLLLAELGGHVAPGAHAVLVLDGAGWHGAKDLRWPGTIAPLPLPASSPELNPQERVWAFLRQHDLARRRVLDHGARLDAGQDAWRRLSGEPGRIRSLCSYPWATVS
jgi:DDE superfamily endonuclease